MARAAITDLRVERLVGMWPAEEDSAYWLKRSVVEVQVQTRPKGKLPVIVETVNRSFVAGTVEPAAIGA